jgi:hypothetical protein
LIRGFNFFGNNKVVDRLDKIYTLLDERMNKPKSVFGDKDGDGDVENSIQDQRARNEAAEAEEAKQVMAVLAYRGMKEGSAIYRKVGKNFMQLHPEVDYPMILELVKTFQAEESHSRSK